MKLRLLDDSIRLRLSRTEVLAAEQQGRVEARTRFPDGSNLVFALESVDQDSRSASFADNRLIVRLPAQELANWAHDDAAVSIHGDLSLPDGDQLTLLVEKDFQCVTPRDGEDQSDLFPNPDVSC